MSTAADVIARAIDLLGRVEALIDSTRGIELPEVAAELRVAGTAASLTEQLAQLVRKIREQLQVVTALSQLSNLFGLIEPLLGGLQRLFVDAGRHVAELGLQDAFSAGDAITTGFQRLQETVALGSSMAVAPEQLDGLRRGMDEVITALDELASDFRTAGAEG